MLFNKARNTYTSNNQPVSVLKSATIILGAALTLSACGGHEEEVKAVDKVEEAAEIARQNAPEPEPIPMDTAPAEVATSEEESASEPATTEEAATDATTTDSEGSAEATTDESTTDESTEQATDEVAEASAEAEPKAE